MPTAWRRPRISTDSGYRTQGPQGPLHQLSRHYRDEPYYPINDARNEALYKQYEELAAQEGDVIFAGRLGGYKYYDMDKAIAAAFQLVRNELGVEPTEA